jgi:hypothetical protein
MSRTPWLLLLLVAGVCLLPAADDDVVFHSDVSLVRVDAQVLDRDNRAITGLRSSDFVLRDEGKVQEIKNFASESMPIDVLFLLDVSTSMRPHVELIASASNDALRTLKKEDRVGIMVFDRASRLRMPLRFADRDDVDHEFQTLLRQESFHGGTDITRGLLDAAAYVGRSGRKGARRAIIILTDDQTERDRDEERVGQALINADAVLSALIAPDAMHSGMHYPGGGYPGGGYPGGGGHGYPGRGRTGGYPGGGLPWPGSGGVILGPRGGYGGHGGQVPGQMGSHTRSAGTSEIALDSGGDSMPAGDASALATTLARLRQRYALYFRMPAGAKPKQERTIEVALAPSARSRYTDSEVRYRKVYLTPSEIDPASAATESASTQSQGTTPQGASTEPPAPPAATPAPTAKRRTVLDDSGGPRGPIVPAKP